MQEDRFHLQTHMWFIAIPTPVPGDLKPPGTRTVHTHTCMQALIPVRQPKTNPTQLWWLLSQVHVTGTILVWRNGFSKPHRAPFDPVSCRHLPHCPPCGPPNTAALRAFGAVPSAWTAPLEMGKPGTLISLNLSKRVHCPLCLNWQAAPPTTLFPQVNLQLVTYLLFTVKVSKQ